MQRTSRHDLVRALASRYAHVGKREKGQVLDEVCQLTGYTRKHAVALLRHPPSDEPLVKRTRQRSVSYGQAEVELLQLCWLVTDGIVRPSLIVSYHSAAALVMAAPAARALGLDRLYADSTGYDRGDCVAYPVTGDFAQWTEDQGIPTVEVELPDHSTTDFEANYNAFAAIIGAQRARVAASGDASDAIVGADEKMRT